MLVTLLSNPNFIYVTPFWKDDQTASHFKSELNLSFKSNNTPFYNHPTFKNYSIFVKKKKKKVLPSLKGIFPKLTLL